MLTCALMTSLHIQANMMGSFVIPPVVELLRLQRHWKWAIMVLLLMTAAGVAVFTYLCLRPVRAATAFKPHKHNNNNNSSSKWISWWHDHEQHQRRVRTSKCTCNECSSIAASPIANIIRGSIRTRHGTCNHHHYPRVDTNWNCLLRDQLCIRWHSSAGARISI